MSPVTVNVNMLAVLGGLPIAVVFALMVGLRWSAARAMGIGWVLATGLGLALWRMETTWWAAAALYGALQALEIILIVFGAILLMNHLDGSGAVSRIRSHFAHLSDDRRVQLLLVGLGFMTLVEGAAGFGTPGALAAPLLVGLGFPPLAAAVFGLFFNAAQPPFGAAGTPVIGGLGAVIDERVLTGDMTVPAFLADVSTWTAVVTGTTLVFWGLFGVFLLLFWFGQEDARSIRGALRGTVPVLPLALLLGSVAGVTQFIMAWRFGPELPNIAAGFMVLGVGITLATRGVLVPKDSWEFPRRHAWPVMWRGEPDAGQPGSEAAKARMPVWLAWTPYLLVAVVLVLTRWPGLGLSDLLRSHVIGVDRLLGEDLSFSIAYLYLPGLVPFIPVAILTGLIHRMDRSAVTAAWRNSFRQIRGPAMTLIVAVSMTQIMIQSATNGLGRPGMMEALSQALAWSAGAAIPFVAPWIGALGSFVTGSSTSSNVLFGALQHDAATDAGLSRTIVVALQNAGSGIGNMVSVLNIAAVCGVTGLTGREGDLLRKLTVPTLALATLAGAAGLVLVLVFAVQY
jgi:lactate permease